MRETGLALMREHVRSIHRVITGSDPPEGDLPKESSATFEEVLARFAELDAMIRGLPKISERVPQFSFSPPLDVIETDRETIVELGVPGIERDDVDVTLEDDRLSISGMRSSHRPIDGRIYRHAEMPRGPFSRVILLHDPTNGSPQVDVSKGVIQVRLAKTSRAPVPRA